MTHLASTTYLHATYSETFQSLQPVYFPGFVFSWMALISHRLFLPKLLITPNGEVRSLFIPALFNADAFDALGMAGILSPSCCAFQLRESSAQVW